jgi:hypothetical protein
VNPVTKKGYDAAEAQEKEDDLDRWRFAAEIVDVVLATPPDWSARIGILGKWGEGKSTVLQFAEHMLRKKGSIVFTFSPWAIQNWNDLWEDFGNRLSEALSDADVPFDNSWKKFAKDSGKWLESIGVDQLAEAAAAALGRDKAYTAAFGALGRWLRYDGAQIHAIRDKLQDKRLVVLIDDLDRCAPDLIPQLLLSLRELLDLPGFTFLLAFDDEIVARALTEANPAWVEGTNFLEKILDFRFYLPTITEVQKKKLISRAMTRYCPFVPEESIKEIQDLLPNNPRKLKSLIRSLAALQPQLTRHDPEELNWVDMWLAQMLRLESYRFFERLLKDGVLEKEAGTLYQAMQRLRTTKPKDETEGTNESLLRLMKEAGVEDSVLTQRLVHLIEACRSRSSFKFRYMCQLAVRPHAVTWKEFRAIRTAWEVDRLPAVLAQWISRHAEERIISVEDVEAELFEAISGKRNELLSVASDSKSLKEHESLLAEVGTLTEMLEQFLLNLQKLTAPRFQKVYELASHWIGFRKNAADRLQRDREEELLLKLLSSASDQLSTKILELVLPDSWDFDIDDGTLQLRRTLREKCEAIVAPKAAEQAIGFMARDGAIRSLTEHGRFPAVEYCLFHSRSPVWRTSLREELLSLIRRGRVEQVIYTNVRDFLDLLVYGLERGIDSIGRQEIGKLLSDEEFVRSLWETVISREIQYRMLITFIRARRSLIKNGASEAALPLTEELKSRLEEESQANAPAPGSAENTPTVPGPAGVGVQPTTVSVRAKTRLTD